MAEDEGIFDPSLKKKKKKIKKTKYDIDAAFAEGTSEEVSEPQLNTNEAEVPFKEEEVVDNNVDVDLDFTKKKKKGRKKPVGTDDLDVAVSEVKDKGGVQDEDVGEDNFDIDLLTDLSKTKKKKNKKKKDFDELMAEEKLDDKENVDENSVTWTGSDRDYTYEELLNRAFEIMRDKNPDMASGKKQKFVMRPPQVVKIGAKKTSFANFTEICRMLHRQAKHLLDFLLAELGTSGSVDGNSQLIIKGRFQQKQIENVLRRYIKEYVTCHTCRSPDTILQKDTRLFFLQCETCGSRCSVASIKSGFQAVTSKRAAIRAKTA
ncbi:eukaryotic translation initiation factor 2 subunit 2 isoform X2 [Cylas formicarius]|uniref:eukaryotic translation initiation factor 2 subunit 2 isoform X2 n=1 Tax=Cylas formicarius TaxID=197179 RepID=UPI0029589AA7|nr:eukaryotic translation initiation factor 2 subunit 2 isoform X2 [Cylas formicarius]